MDRKQEKELASFRKKIENRNPKAKAIVLQPPELQQRSHSFPRQRIVDESIEVFKANGCALDFPQTKKAFTTDKEIEQLNLFASEAKMKTLTEKKVVVSTTSKTESKMSLNQIKESQLQRDMVSKSTSSMGQMRKGPTPPPQGQSQQITAGTFPVSRNTSFPNLSQMPSQTTQPPSKMHPTTNGNTTNFPSNVAQWGGSQQELSQWKASIEKQWAADNQAWLSSEGVTWPSTGSAHFVPVTTVNNQPYAQPPNGQKQKVPHR